LLTFILLFGFLISAHVFVCTHRQAVRLVRLLSARLSVPVWAKIRLLPTASAAAQTASAALPTVDAPARAAAAATVAVDTARVTTTDASAAADASIAADAGAAVEAGAAPASLGLASLISPGESSSARSSAVSHCPSSSTATQTLAQNKTEMLAQSGVLACTVAATASRVRCAVACVAADPVQRTLFTAEAARLNFKFKSPQAPTTATTSPTDSGGLSLSSSSTAAAADSGADAGDGDGAASFGRFLLAHASTAVFVSRLAEAGAAAVTVHARYRDPAVGASAWAADATASAPATAADTATARAIVNTARSIETKTEAETGTGAVALAPSSYQSSRRRGPALLPLLPLLALGGLCALTPASGVLTSPSQSKGLCGSDASDRLDSSSGGDRGPVLLCNGHVSRQIDPWLALSLSGAGGVMSGEGLLANPSLFDTTDAFSCNANHNDCCSNDSSSCLGGDAADCTPNTSHDRHDGGARRLPPLRRPLPLSRCLPTEVNVSEALALARARSIESANRYSRVQSPGHDRAHAYSSTESKNDSTSLNAKTTPDSPSCDSSSSAVASADTVEAWFNALTKSANAIARRTSGIETANHSGCSTAMGGDNGMRPCGSGVGVQVTTPQVNVSHAVFQGASTFDSTAWGGCAYMAYADLLARSTALSSSNKMLMSAVTDSSENAGREIVTAAQ